MKLLKPSTEQYVPTARLLFCFVPEVIWHDKLGS